jgi:hypothetical protein
MVLQSCTGNYAEKVARKPGAAASVPAMGSVVRWRGSPQGCPVGRAKENRMKFGVLQRGQGRDGYFSSDG